MKNYFRLGFAAVALALFFNAFAVTETKAQGVLNEILKRMEAHRNSLTSLRSSVTMIKTDSVLKESDTYEGTASYLPAKGREALIRIDWTKPAKETLSVVNGQYVIYRERLGQAIMGNAKDAKGGGKANGALSFMSMSKEQLKANYTVKYIGQENVTGGIPTWRLELTPKTAQKYKLAELWVDGNGMPVQAKVVENNDDTTTVLLSNLQKNITLNASIFKIDLPKGTQIVKG
jgi:outer membrane lipoprotein-sorting protein